MKREIENLRMTTSCGGLSLLIENELGKPFSNATFELNMYDEGSEESASTHLSIYELQEIRDKLNEIIAEYCEETGNKSNLPTALADENNWEYIILKGGYTHKVEYPEGCEESNNFELPEGCEYIHSIFGGPYLVSKGEPKL